MPIGYAKSNAFIAISEKYLNYPEQYYLAFTLLELNMNFLVNVKHITNNTTVGLGSQKVRTDKYVLYFTDNNTISIMQFVVPIYLN